MEEQDQDEFHRLVYQMFEARRRGAERARQAIQDYGASQVAYGLTADALFATGLHQAQLLELDRKAQLLYARTYTRAFLMTAGRILPETEK